MSSKQDRKRRAWSECEKAAELARMIDATPREFRVPILEAAIGFEADPDFARAELVGVYRSLLFDSVYEFTEFKLTATSVQSLPGKDLQARIAYFAAACDLPEVQLGVCDLLEQFCRGDG